MSAPIGWKSGHPDHGREVEILRELDNGRRITWRGKFCHWAMRWATYDGIYIPGVLGWREKREA
ncbi:TPA: hypothetical protein OT951_003680 [Pseudomonas aeruginosa]|nr:hypothetical protein [Pseudomonas aeruginosa]